MNTTESQIELDLVAKLGDRKYTYRPCIGDRAALEVNFREKFEALNCVERITAQSQKIDVLKTHKRGLMQQLFPVTDAKVEVEA